MHKKLILYILVALPLLIITTGCESDDNNEIVTPTAPQNGSGSSWDASKIDGTWRGKSGSGQISSTLLLSSDGWEISGALQWPSDTRSVGGSITEPGRALLYIEGGDDWRVSWNGNRMSGTGIKPDGSTYSISFSR